MTSEATRPSMNFSSSRFFWPFLTLAGAADGGRRSEPWAPSQMTPSALPMTRRYWGSSSLARDSARGSAAFVVFCTCAIGKSMSATPGELFSEAMFRVAMG